MTTHPVLVVGAGPTGLTAALELARLGVDVRIVDRAASPSTTSRALGVQARTLELLRPRGVAEALLAAGNRVHHTALHAGASRIADIDFSAMPSEYDFILMLAQSETERLLAARAAELGVVVERGVEFVDLDQDRDVARVTLRHGDGRTETAAASYVIAADGSHSAIRKSLGVSFEGRAFTQNYVLGDVHLAGPMPEDQLSIFLAANGFLAVFPMGGGRFRFMATDPDGVTGDDAEPTMADVQTLYDRTVHVPARLNGMTWSSRFRINSRIAGTLRSGRVFLGGDAAHVHSPAGGQGMNAGIQDMINLAWKLALVLDGSAHSGLLDTYETDRLPVIRALVAMTERATAAFNSTNPLAHAALTRLAPVVLSRAAVRRAAPARLGQLSATYRRGRLASGGGGLGRLRAGDRVPDVALPDGRLYDLVDGTTPTLLLVGENPSVEAVRSDWPGVPVVRVSALTELAPDGGWLVVRPDGYLAAAGTDRDASRLTAWLDRWLVRSPVAVGRSAPGYEERPLREA